MYRLVIVAIMGIPYTLYELDSTRERAIKCQKLVVTMRERQKSTIPNFIGLRSVDLESGPSNTNLGREIILWKERLSP